MPFEELRPAQVMLVFQLSGEVTFPGKRKVCLEAERVGQGVSWCAGARWGQDRTATLRKFSKVAMSGSQKKLVPPGRLP